MFFKINESFKNKFYMCLRWLDVTLHAFILDHYMTDRFDLALTQTQADWMMDRWSFFLLICAELEIDSCFYSYQQHDMLRYEPHPPLIFYFVHFSHVLVQSTLWNILTKNAKIITIVNCNDNSCRLTASLLFPS